MTYKVKTHNSGARSRNSDNLIRSKTVQNEMKKTSKVVNRSNVSRHPANTSQARDLMSENVG